MLAGFFFAKGDPFAAGVFVFLLIILAVAVTLMVSAFLSRTLLKGMPSAFVLELPPYRRPQIGQVIIRSVLDRTAYVLGRAVTVAIPAGAVIWLCQNVTFGGYTLLYGLTVLLEPLGALMGLSGVILAAFLLGIPANEIVIPILLMVYSQSGMLVEAEGMAQAGAILTANGWTWVTAVCTILFSLNHFPCATTLLTIRKETGSWFWTGVSFLLPTVVGILLCILVNFLVHWGQLIF
ncbi:MAG: ferrous iron transporter B [Anaerotignum sp.]|nr:ferrous iron transporter B [Anaerotignum sp.]